MIEREQERLGTADMAAAGQGATIERERARGHRHHGRHDDDVELRSHVERDHPRHDERGNMDALFAREEADDYRRRWEQVQTAFVDEPRGAVERADELVAQVMKRLAGVFADERAGLEQQWARGDNVSTEDLRLALRRYRWFFDRLLNV